MSSSAAPNRVKLLQGDLLKSKAQTLVNTVNCVGVMGKGIAASFKKKYPAMYQDYVRRCSAGEVKLGQPYAYSAGERLIVNFPTKQHWRSVSRLSDIERGLEYLRCHIDSWGIKSIAVPPLGCGNGQLEWSVVGPTLLRYLNNFGIPVELYVPHEVDVGGEQLMLMGHSTSSGNETKIEPALVALVEVLARLEREKFHWPVGRVMFQKLAYFATVAGLPTELEYEAADYGPYAGGLKRALAKLQNNGLLRETQRGNMFEVRVGRTFEDASTKYGSYVEGWESTISRVVDLMARFNTYQAEVAASVHYVATCLSAQSDRAPYAADVIAGVERWKIRRTPPILREDIAQAVVNLAMQRWISVQADESITKFIAMADQF